MAIIEKEKALDVVRQMVADGQVSQEVAEKYFPELAESEDEKIREQILDYFVAKKVNEPQPILDSWIAWIKRQGEQKPAGWSEDDKNHVKSILSTIECCKAQFPNAQAVVEAYNADIDWIKSLRPQSHWKPTDEQMEYLAKAIVTLGDEGNCKTASILNDLRVELKKLRGE